MAEYAHRCAYSWFERSMSYNGSDMRRYNPKEIEPKWQKTWEEQGTYVADLASNKPKYMGFGMFNYPSGAGIHVGHVRNYTIPDVITRVKRQQGFETYQPVGWDSFGLPAENFAIKTGVSPQVSTKKAIEKYQKQYRAMGWAVDWTKEINTTDPGYYKWTQWIFTKLFEHGLAYQKESPQWWCDQCKTVLADEQVLAGKCWRHDAPDDPLVSKRNLRQWFFKITEYADEMLEATDALDWTPSVKASQKSWIGKSTGAEITFKVAGTAETISTFTTRPDTLFGATFMVLAPEHPLVEKITSEQQVADVTAYIEEAQRKSDIERQELSREKTGVFTGAHAVNPVNGEKMPIWIADYVLTGYGTGAIMAVPAHDTRDFAFANKFDLPIRFVVEPTYGEPQGDDTFKKSIFAIVRNPQKNKAIVLDWGPRKERHGGKMLIGGGVEEAESYVSAATREISEETGYKNFELVKEAEFSGHGYFYSNTKNKNMQVSGTGLLFDLIDEEKNETQLDDGEKNKFDVTWQPIDAVAGMLDDGIHETFYRYLALGECYSGEGVMVNSGDYNGLSSADAREKIVADLEKKGVAESKVNYKMRDWLISRQRYWGAPIPIIHCEDCGPVAVPAADLPVALPEIEQYQPTGGDASVLAGVDEWVNAPCPSCKKTGKRETDTMDGYVCSSWYFLRYVSPHNDSVAWDAKTADQWLPVDFYNGGDHATAHLLYARFFTRFFHSIGLAPSPEPFKKMVYNGKVRASDGSMFSKSKGNGVDPLEVIESGYGADALRLYEMFAAPVEMDVLWDTQGIPGTYRFLNRVWTVAQNYIEAEPGESPADAVKELQKTTHYAIKKVTDDIQHDKFNTAIAAMMAAVNQYYKLKEEYGVQQSPAWAFAVESLLQLVAPFAPHLSEELWHDVGHIDSIHIDHWPLHKEAYLVEDTLTIVVQINGKVRATIEVPADMGKNEMVQQAQDHERIMQLLAEKPIKKTVVVPNKLINFVV